MTLTTSLFSPKTLLLHVNSNGMAACTTTGLGFEWLYSGTPKAMTTGCSTLGF